LLHRAITFTSLNYVKTRNSNFQKGKLNGTAPSRGYNSAFGDLFGLKLTGDIEQKLRKTMLVLLGHQTGFTRIKGLFLAQLEKAIVTKQHFSRNDCFIRVFCW